MATGKTNSIVVVGGDTDFSVVTATAAEVRSGRKFYNSSGVLTTGTAATKAAATITPGTTDQTIASGTYCTGTQTIKGDADLKAQNIKNGVSIFGVTGNYSATTPNVVTGTFVGTGSSAVISGLSSIISATPNLVMWKISTSNSATTANQLQIAVGDESGGDASGRGSVYMTNNFYSSGTVSVTKGSSSVSFSPTGLTFTSGVTYSYKLIFHPNT